MKIQNDIIVRYLCREIMINKNAYIYEKKECNVTTTIYICIKMKNVYD